MFKISSILSIYIFLRIIIEIIILSLGFYLSFSSYTEEEMMNKNKEENITQLCIYKAGFTIYSNKV
jgi:Tfp pilus assembly protein PilO